MVGKWPPQTVRPLLAFQGRHFFHSCLTFRCWTLVAFNSRIKASFTAFLIHHIIYSIIIHLLPLVHNQESRELESKEEAKIKQGSKVLEVDRKIIIQVAKISLSSILSVFTLRL
uniref:Uncharacterized protein n=1 Tax=Opuntia streptacantha TaxID=393608 RepID=A0A7C9D9W2_OPUST